MSEKQRDSSKQLLPTLSLSALGVVFGDIGTSPLYAVRQVFQGGLSTDMTHILGVLSLIFWALTLVVTTKYGLFIMRADNKGEGGIMALTALALQGNKQHPELKRIILTIGLFGTALFYGDSIIAPAISVLSAVEGLEIISPRLEYFVVPLTLTILTALFLVQAKGAGKVGTMFAPVMGIWFIVLAILGLVNIFQHPEVLRAINPYYAFNLLNEQGWRGFVILGAVMLVITGAEALYADIGHFGLLPIRAAWFKIVFPALLLNYFGQGALLIGNPQAVENPFYLLAPSWAMYPLLVLSTAATVIASQGVISGAFSITRQAIQFGYCPRMTIQHTSGDRFAQVYIPAVNWLLMASVFLVVISFQSSSALASAYGIAVTGTMIVDTVLAFIVIQAIWRWGTARSVSFLMLFLVVDLAFLFANSLKLTAGGWLSLLFAAVIFSVMTTWIRGKEMLAKYIEDRRMLFEELQVQLLDQTLARVPGSAIYMARSLHGVPLVLLHNLEHNRVIHDKIIVLTIVTKDEPYVDEAHRVKIRSFGDSGNFFRVKLYFGFQEEQDVRRALQLCCHEGLKIDPKTVSFFVGSERLSFRRKNPMANWQRSLFRFLTHNSSSAIEYFKIPVDRVIELGIRVEL